MVLSVLEQPPLNTPIRIIYAVDTFGYTDTHIFVIIMAPVRAPYGCRVTHKLVVAGEPSTWEQFFNSYMVAIPDSNYLHLAPYIVYLKKYINTSVFLYEKEIKYKTTVSPYGVFP